MSLTGAEKQRRWRQRQRNGGVSLRIDISDLEGLADAMIETGRIPDTNPDGYDLNIIAAAIPGILCDWKKSVTRLRVDRLKPATVSIQQRNRDNVDVQPGGPRRK